MRRFGLSGRNATGHSMTCIARSSDNVNHAGWFTCEGQLLGHAVNVVALGTSICARAQGDRKGSPPASAGAEAGSSVKGGRPNSETQHNVPRLRGQGGNKSEKGGYRPRIPKQPFHLARTRDLGAKLLARLTGLGKTTAPLSSSWKPQEHAEIPRETAEPTQANASSAAPIMTIGRGRPSCGAALARAAEARTAPPRGSADLRVPGAGDAPPWARQR